MMIKLKKLQNFFLIMFRKKQNIIAMIIYIGFIFLLLALIIDKESSIDDVWQHVTKNKKIELDNVMATVNMEYVKSSYVIRDGDEIAFFPPVTGG